MAQCPPLSYASGISIYFHKGSRISVDEKYYTYETRI